MFDGHAHLDEIEEIDPALDRAKAVGIRAVISVGMDTSSNRNTLILAEKHPGFVLPALERVMHFLEDWQAEPIYRLHLL